MTDLSYIESNIQAVQNQINAAAESVGRDSGDVTLIAVTKTYSTDHVAAAVHAGVSNAGENRIQEAVPKIDEISDDLSLSPLRWHLIGHLQSNKAKLAVQYFDLIHSLDSLKLAHEINRQAETAGRIMPVLMQVNVSGEESKGGFTPDSMADALAEILEVCPRLAIHGFMTMPPLDDPEAARPVFRRLRELRDAMKSKFNHAQFTPTELSMGMSNDFTVAIEEGATMVRVGSAIFGRRV